MKRANECIAELEGTVERLTKERDEARAQRDKMVDGISTILGHRGMADPDALSAIRKLLAGIKREGAADGRSAAGNGDVR